jgi:hypothetical protein
MKSKRLVLRRNVSVAVDTSSHFEVSELIRRRAYELFEARGNQPGHDVEDWLKAERELGQRRDGEFKRS